MLGKLSENDRVVPIALHVDYFNDPWPDPFSDAKFSERQAQYSQIYNNERKLKNPAYLYLTPLIMVDGRTPMVGSNKEAAGVARDAIRRGLAEKPGVRIDLNLDGKPEDRNRSLNVAVAPLVSALRERSILLQIMPFEDLVTTQVERGESKGKTYTGRSVARDLILREVKVPRSGKAEVSVPIEFPKTATPQKGGVVVVAQDNDTGKVYQAAVVRWEPKAAMADPAR